MSAFALTGLETRSGRVCRTQVGSGCREDVRERQMSEHEESGAPERSRVLLRAGYADRLTDAQLADFLFESSFIGLAIVDDENKFRAVNATFAGWLNRPASQLCDMTWMQVTADDDIEEDLKAVQAVLRGEQHEYEMVKTYLPKAGAPFEARLVVEPFRDEDGKRCVFFFSQVVRIDANQVVAMMKEQGSAARIANLGSKDIETILHAHPDLQTMVVVRWAMDRKRWIIAALIIAAILGTSFFQTVGDHLAGFGVGILQNVRAVEPAPSGMMDPDATP